LTPFPVQEATIPDILAGRDVSGKAPTGSGKTLAFGLPILARIQKAASRRPRALILAPTRELADQINRDLRPLASAMGRRVAVVYGGVGYGSQRSALNRGADVLVATPGRLEDLIEQGAVDLGQVDVVVLDEADRMADMGFLPAMTRILDQVPGDRQTVLFSATLDGDVAVLSRRYQRNPVSHEAGTVEPRSSEASHHFWLVEHHQRVGQTAELVDHVGSSIVFTRTRRGADRLARQLSKEGIAAVAMHGGRSQSQRERALDAFARGRAQALIATDVAARGIHIDDVASVIHYDPPADQKDYLHRSGRTGRAGSTGLVVSLVTPEKRREVQRLQRHLDVVSPIEAPRVQSLMRPVVAERRPPRPRSTPGRSPRAVPGATTASSPPSTASKHIYVSNLPWSTTSGELGDLFGRHGTVTSATIATDRRDGRSRGFGFVEMARPLAAGTIRELHGSLLDGRELVVRYARPRGDRKKR
jgi:superfamily II DNA/RNA helicase